MGHICPIRSVGTHYFMWLQGPYLQHLPEPLYNPSRPSEYKFDAAWREVLRKCDILRNIFKVQRFGGTNLKNVSFIKQKHTATILVWIVFG